MTIARVDQLDQPTEFFFFSISERIFSRFLPSPLLCDFASEHGEIDSHEFIESFEPPQRNLRRVDPKRKKFNPGRFLQ